MDVLWEAEPNDNALTQVNGPIVSGLTYYGTFPDPAYFDKDYFTFDLASSQTVDVWMTHIPASYDYPDIPSHTIFVKRFGTWREALQAAGIPLIPL